MPESQTADATVTESPSHRRWVPRMSGVDLVLVVGLVLVAVQLWLKGDLLSRSFFIQDDYVYIAQAARQPFGWDYLMQNYDGQFMPFGFAVTWVLTRIDPYNWTSASVLLLVLQAGASLALLRALRVLFGSRLLVLVPFALYLITPMTMPAFSWYAAAINSLPIQIAIAMALAAHVRYLRRQRTTYLVQTLGWTAFGMLTFVKAVAIPPLLFVITAAYFFNGSWGETVHLAWRRHSRAWWWLLRVLAVEIVLYCVTWVWNGTDGKLQSLDADQIIGFLARLIGRTFTLFFVGGPWEWSGTGASYGTPNPPNGQVALAIGVVAVLVVLSVRYRRVAYRAWVILLGYVLLADAAPVVFGRLPMVGPVLGTESRYVADAAPVLVICLTLAFLALLGEKEPYLRPLPSGALLPGLAGLAGGAVAIGSVWCLHTYRAELNGDRGRDYLAHAQAALARYPHTDTIFPTVVPTAMMAAVFGDDRMTTRVLSPLVSRARLRRLDNPRPTQKPRVLGTDGRLHPAGVYGTGAKPPPNGGNCWYLTQQTTRIRLRQKVGVGDYVMSVGFLANKKSRLRVRFNKKQTVTFPAKPKLGRYTFMIRGGGSTIEVTKSARHAPVCVTDVTVGFAVPRK